MTTHRNFFKMHSEHVVTCKWSQVALTFPNFVPLNQMFYSVPNRADTSRQEILCNIDTVKLLLSYDWHFIGISSNLQVFPLGFVSFIAVLSNTYRRVCLKGLITFLETTLGCQRFDRHVKSVKSLFNLVKAEVQFTYAEIFSVYVLFKG